MSIFKLRAVGVLSALFLCAFFFFYQSQSTGLDTLEESLMLQPASFISEGMSWQVLTYIFVHQSWFEFLVSFFLFLILGSYMEMQFGTARFLVYFLFCTVFVGFSYLAIETALLRNTAGPLHGSFGASAGLLVVFSLASKDRILFTMGDVHFHAKFIFWVTILGTLATGLIQPKLAIIMLQMLAGVTGGLVFLLSYHHIFRGRLGRLG